MPEKDLINGLGTLLRATFPSIKIESRGKSLTFLLERSIKGYSNDLHISIDGGIDVLAFNKETSFSLSNSGVYYGNKSIPYIDYRKDYTIRSSSFPEDIAGHIQRQISRAEADFPWFAPEGDRYDVFYALLAIQKTESIEQQNKIIKRFLQLKEADHGFYFAQRLLPFILRAVCSGAGYPVEKLDRVLKQIAAAKELI